MTQTTLATRHKRLPLPACHILSINFFQLVHDIPPFKHLLSLLHRPSVTISVAMSFDTVDHPKPVRMLGWLFHPNDFIRKITTRFLRIHPAVVTSKPSKSFFACSCCYLHEAHQQLLLIFLTVWKAAVEAPTFQLPRISLWILSPLSSCSGLNSPVKRYIDTYVPYSSFRRVVGHPQSLDYHHAKVTAPVKLSHTCQLNFIVVLPSLKVSFFDDISLWSGQPESFSIERYALWLGALMKLLLDTKSHERIILFSSFLAKISPLTSSLLLISGVWELGCPFLSFPLPSLFLP